MTTPAVDVGNIASSGIADGGSTTRDQAITLAADRWYCVWVSNSDGTPQTATLAWVPTSTGTPETCGTAALSLGPLFTFLRVTLWVVNGASFTAGAGNFRATFAGSQGERFVTVVPISGDVDATPYVTPIDSSSASGGTFSVTADPTSSGQLCVCLGMGFDTGPPTTWAFNSPSDSEHSEVQMSSSAYHAHAVQSGTASGATKTMTWTITSNGAGASWVGAIVVFNEGSSATLVQEGFRFGNDDASESAHTFAAAQDTDHTAPLGSNLLLRAIVDATGDPGAIAYTLRYQKNGSGGYVAVPVGSPASNIASVGTMGTGTSSTSNTSIATTTATNSLAAGDTALLVCVTDNTTTTDGNSNDHTGCADSLGNTWEKLYEYTNGEGSAAAGVTVSLWMLYATAAVATGTVVTVTLGTARVDKVTSVWKFTSNTKLRLSTAATGNATDASNGFGSASFSSLPSLQRLYFRGLGKEANSTTANTVTTNFTNITAQRSRNNAAAVLVRGEFRINTSTGETSNPTLAVSGDTAGIFVALEETPRELYVATSGNITAGGEDTTARLTAPSGKSTSDFTTGRRWDDENGSDTIDITSDFYTELEWCLQSQAPAVLTDYFEFRVYAGSSPLNTYSVTPKWTIGSAAAVLTAVAGSYSVTGNATALQRSRIMAAVAGTYSYTGQTVTLTAAVARTLVVSSGTYAYTGVDAQIDVAIAPASGSYSITGNAATLNRGKTMTASAGSYAQTGNSTGLLSGRRLIAVAGSYSQTGGATGLLFGHRMPAVAGAYSITGSDAGLSKSRSLVVTAGSYSLTGSDTGLLFARLMPAVAGTYAQTGVAVTLTHTSARTLASVSGTYALTGNTANLLRARLLGATAGAYSVTGNATGLLTARIVGAASGSYGITGNAQGLVYTPAGSSTMLADSGSYSVTGHAVSFPYAHRLAPVSGSYSATGNAVALAKARSVSLVAGSYSYTGVAVGYSRSRVLLTVAGAYSVTGNAVGFVYSAAFVPIGGARQRLGSLSGADTSSRVGNSTGRASRRVGR